MAIGPYRPLLEIEWILIFIIIVYISTLKKMSGKFMDSAGMHYKFGKSIDHIRHIVYGL